MLMQSDVKASENSKVQYDAKGKRNWLQGKGCRLVGIKAEEGVKRSKEKKKKGK